MERYQRLKKISGKGLYSKGGSWLWGKFLNDNVKDSTTLHRGVYKAISGAKSLYIETILLWIKTGTRYWNIRFYIDTKSFGSEQNVDELCIYKKIIKKNVAFLILYVDDIFLIDNDVGFYTDIKIS